MLNILYYKFIIMSEGCSFWDTYWEWDEGKNNKENKDFCKDNLTYSERLKLEQFNTARNSILEGSGISSFSEVKNNDIEKTYLWNPITIKRWTALESVLMRKDTLDNRFDINNITRISVDKNDITINVISNGITYTVVNWWSIWWIK